MIELKVNRAKDDGYNVWTTMHGNVHELADEAAAGILALRNKIEEHGTAKHAILFMLMVLDALDQKDVLQDPPLDIRVSTEWPKEEGGLS